MDAFPQLTLDDNLLLNSERRLPCVLLLDRSFSMSGEKIDGLNKGLDLFFQEISSDLMALKRVETAIVSFGPVNVEQEFATMDEISMPILDADNDTPMGAAITKGLDLIKVRQSDYRNAGVLSYKPWIFLITDGAATDDTTAAAHLIRDREAQNKLNFFSVGVKGADFQGLKSLSIRPPIALEGNNFEGLFEFVSIIMSSTAASRPGDAIDIPNPETTGFGKIVA